MSLNGAYAFQSPVASTDTSLEIAVRDPLLKGDNGGVRYAFDTAFGFSYPGGPIASRPAPGAPANGAVIYDIAERGDGAVLLSGAGPIAYAGGGFDVTATLAAGCAVEAPAAATADLLVPAGEDDVTQNYLIMTYIKLPEAANWPTGSGISSLFSVGNYTTEAALLTLSMGNGVTGRISVRRQLTGSTNESTLQLTDAGAAGQVCQIACWRNGAEQGIRLKRASGVTKATIAVGADNTQDFSARRAQFGRPVAFGGTNAAYNGVRVYRGAIENLARSLRDPVAVLDADWARVAARIAASAAANGGTSQIFV